jgi:hypothetical protein
MTSGTHCNGSGYCLTQVDENNYASRYECPHKCAPVRCPNFELCQDVLPQWVMSTHRGTCMNCAVIFAGPVQRIECEQHEECCICAEDVNVFFQFQQCTHKVCATCFRRFHFHDHDEEGSEASLDSRCPLCRRDAIRHWQRDE